jgi:hypothetical protein
MRRTGLIAAALVLAVFCLQASGVQGDDKLPKAPANLKKAGTVDITEYEVGILAVDNVWGHGTVTAGGKTKKFKLGGMGVGGAGGAKISAMGNVYNMTDINLFPGAYTQVSAGATAGDASKAAPFWLQNTNGVVLELRSKQEGLALTGGANGIVVRFED